MSVWPAKLSQLITGQRTAAAAKRSVWPITQLESTPPPEQPPLQFTNSYDAATRAVEIRFTRPPEPYRTIRVDLLEGIRTFDGAPVRPWMLTFSVGG